MTRARDRAASVPTGAALPATSTSTSNPNFEPPREPNRWTPPGLAALAGITGMCARYAPRALRLSLALIFVWFGVLKVTGDSPVEALLGATLPFLDPGITVPAIGLVEMALGLAVAVGRAPRLMLLALVAHLIGTFLTFVTATDLVIQGGNPLLLTSDGEFVVKNVVLISAALVLVGRLGRTTSADPTA